VPASERPAIDDLRGVSFLVTGASSGIGRALAGLIAARGGRVVLAARSPERTMAVVEALRRTVPAADARFLHVDLAELDSVRRAAREFLASYGALDVLVNNAGVAGTFGLSRDRFDLTYATNHLGPFLLTNLLLPRLVESSAPRIVNVSSVAQMRVRRIDWSRLERRSEPTRGGFLDYATTKLMNVLHAKELARRLQTTRVTTYAVHPGMIASNIWRALPSLLQPAIRLFMRSNRSGAEPLLYCATAPELRGDSGRFYDRFREAPPNPLADDPALASDLWRRSESAVG
jgi:dehydrogenase/reductase SDR family protein 13